MFLGLQNFWAQRDSRDYFIVYIKGTEDKINLVQVQRPRTQTKTLILKFFPLYHLSCSQDTPFPGLSFLFILELFVDNFLYQHCLQVQLIFGRQNKEMTSSSFTKKSLSVCTNNWVRKLSSKRKTYILYYLREWPCSRNDILWLIYIYSNFTENKLDNINCIYFKGLNSMSSDSVYTHEITTSKI